MPGNKKTKETKALVQMNYQCNKSNTELNVKFFLRLQIYFIRIPIQLSYTEVTKLKFMDLKS